MHTSALFTPPVIDVEQLKRTALMATTQLAAMPAASPARGSPGRAPASLASELLELHASLQRIDGVCTDLFDVLQHGTEMLVVIETANEAHQLVVEADSIDRRLRELQRTRGDRPASSSDALIANVASCVGTVRTTLKALEARTLSMMM
jgi:hypothetical protein